MPRTTLTTPLLLEGGGVLSTVEFEWWSSSELGDNKPIIWILHALTANQRPNEWWPELVGPNRCFDTNRYTVFCANMLGSCFGTTGPHSINPATNQIYGNAFPTLTIKDQAAAFLALAETLKLNTIHSLVGASIGGQQALEVALNLQDKIERLVLISTNAIHSPWGIAFNESQRMAIELSSERNAQKGLALARSIAMLSYRSYALYSTNQKRTKEQFDKHRAASYQRYQGEKLQNRFDAWSYWHLTKAMDSHDISRNRETLEAALEQIKADTLIIGAETDLLFPFSEQEFLHQHIPNSALVRVASSYGHDTFLAKQKALSEPIQTFINREIMWRKTTIQTPVTV